MLVSCGGSRRVGAGSRSGGGKCTAACGGRVSRQLAWAVLEMGMSSACKGCLKQTTALFAPHPLPRAAST